MGDVIERTFRGETLAWSVYTRLEADEKGLPYRHWQQADTEGEWVISDDDYVCRVMGVYGPYKNGNGYLTLPYCRAWQDGRSELHYLDYRGQGDYCNAHKGTWLDRELSSGRTRRVIRLYAILLLRDGRVSRAQQEKLAHLWRPDQKEPIATFKRLLKQPKTKHMITKELETLLSEEGIDPRKVILNYKETYRLAIESESLGVAKNVNDRFAEMLGMLGDARQPPAELPPAEREGEIMGLLATNPDYIEVPDDEAFIDELRPVSRPRGEDV